MLIHIRLLLKSKMGAFCGRALRLFLVVVAVVVVFNLSFTLTLISHFYTITDKSKYCALSLLRSRSIGRQLVSVETVFARNLTRLSFTLTLDMVGFCINLMKILILIP